MDATHNHQGILSSSLSHGNEEEERMIERVHGIDRHKQFSTISVLNRQGEEVQFQGACREFVKYVEDLGPTDRGAHLHAHVAGKNRGRRSFDRTESAPV
jgi:hypothetical protein